MAAMLGAVVAAVAGAALAPAILPPAYAVGEPGTLVFSFGERSFNDGPHDFANIRDAAIAPDGKIVVLDTKAATTYIRAFHPNGTLSVRIDFANVVYGHAPDYVSVAPDGNIFARAYQHHDGDVIVFSPNGTHVSTFTPRTPGGHYPAYGEIVFAPNGNFVMRDADDDFAYAVFHPNGTHAFSFGQRGGYHGELMKAMQFAIGPDGKIFVDDNEQIEVFHPNGTHVAMMYRFMGWAPGSHFVVGPAGEFLVEYWGDRSRAAEYYLYYPNGTRAAVFSTNDGNTHVPTFRFGPSGEILFFDTVNSKISIFNGIEPEAVRMEPLLYGPPWPPAYGPPAYGPPAYGPPAYGPHATPPLTLADAAPAFVFGSYGEGPGEFLAPRNIAFGPGGVIAVSDAENNRVQLFHSNGTFALELGSRGSGLGELIGPYGLAFGPNGLLAVSDVGNHRVQVFRIQ